jgi:hypothetical protein
MNDYNANSVAGPVQTNAVHNLFWEPFLTPVFVAINCVSNSTSHAYDSLILSQGGGAPNWDVAISQWQTAIDGVQAPLPDLTDFRLTPPGVFRFTFPGQRGRTNQVQFSSDFANWTVVSNFFGTNAPIVIRDTNVVDVPRRFYRVLRL